MAQLKAFPKRPVGDKEAQDKWLDLIWQLLKSEGYTPTLTNVTNLDGSTARNCPYIRIGNVVVVGLSFSADPTAAAPTNSELGVSLPIPSDFTTQFDATGSVVGGASQVGRVEADTTNNRAKVLFSATDTADREWSGTFVYIIK